MSLDSFTEAPPTYTAPRPVARNPRKPITSTFAVAAPPAGPRMPWDQRRRAIRAHYVRFTLFVVLIFSVQRFITTPGILAAVVCPSSQDSVTIPLRANGTPLHLQMSTNVDDATELNPAANQKAITNLAYLQQWQPPMVRLHFGFRGNVYSLPEAQRGDWNFSVPDAAIAHLRAQGTSFVLNVRSAPPWMFDASGHLPRQNFPLFARYMARLVGWYNKGGFTDDNGIYHASGHSEWVHTWEIWNEPSSGGEIPVYVANRNALYMSPQDYALMYSEVVAAMRAVDPTIVAGGPALSGHSAQAFTWYLSNFLLDATQPISFVSFHFYPTENRQEPDQAVLQNFSQSYGQYISAVQAMMRQIHKNIPLWIDELGFNAYARLPIDPRGTSLIGYAFVADVFTQSVADGVTQVNEFPFVGDAQLGLIDIKSAQPYRTYWLYVMMSQAFPPGSQIMLNTRLPSGVTAIAAISPDRSKLHILLGNLRAASAKDINGHGVPHTVCINLVNEHAGVGLPFGAPATAWTFDASTPSNDLPTSSTQWLINAGQDHLIFQEQLSGYSATLVDLPLN
jgi:hypothetical protein